MYWFYKFSFNNFIFQRLIWKPVSIYFLWFDSWIFKEWKTAKVQNHYVSAYYLHKWLVHFLTCLVVPCLLFLLLVQAGLVSSDQKFSCKWNLSFFKAVPSNRLPFYLGNSLHIISSLFRQFCLFQNAILHKMLKLGFWNFKLFFLRMQFSLVATYFFSSFDYQLELIFASYTISCVLNIYIV